MGLLFSEKGKTRLDEVAQPGLLCAFDFDGTLAPIVPLPEQAHLPDDIRERLLAVAAYAPLAIITGRAVADIRARLGFEPDFVVGNHGMEGVPGWESQASQHRALCEAWLQQLARAFRDDPVDPGIQLENKRYSLSVHYRHVRDREESARRLEALFKRLVPRPRIVGGKYVFNLLAEDACNKGTALARLMEISKARRAIYVGDDVTDEDVFRLRRDDILTIRIERHPESAADFFLGQPRELLDLLEKLAERLRATSARNWMQAEFSGA